jgi:hypothetical protein
LSNLEIDIPYKPSGDGQIQGSHQWRYKKIRNQNWWEEPYDFF